MTESSSIPYKLIQVFDDPDNGFRGNIAAVIVLDSMPESSVLQRIAADLAQPATSFIVPSAANQTFEIRWFAPDAEIGLCGHGSLAAIAFLSLLAPQSSHFTLNFKGGTIQGICDDNYQASIILEGIPVLKKLTPDEALVIGIGKPIIEYWHTANKDIVVLNSEDEVNDMTPDFAKLRERQTFGYSVTSIGNEANFVSRTLVPHVGQLEDHATGSSHAALVPFWSKLLGLKTMDALQLSPRKGKFHCHYNSENNQVSIAGHYSIIAEGSITI